MRKRRIHRSTPYTWTGPEYGMVVGELPRTSLPQINFVGSDIIQTRAKLPEIHPQRAPVLSHYFLRHSLLVD